MEDGVKDLNTKIILIIIFILAMVDSSYATDISSCTTIDSPGQYDLTGNISNSSDTVCINIQANNVVVDGHNFTIDGIDLDSTYGVLLSHFQNYHLNVTIKNVKLQDWDSGIYLGSISNSSIINNEIISNRNGILFLTNNYNNSVKDNKFGNNIFSGIQSRYNSEGIFYNNYFYNNSLDIYVDGGTGVNTLNTSLQNKTNILGQKMTGGNAYSSYSLTCLDQNNNSICDNPYQINIKNIDYHPLRYYNFYSPIIGNSSISATSIYPTSGHNIISVEVTDLAVNSSTNVTVGISYLGSEKNYSMSKITNTSIWTYDFFTGVPGTYIVSAFYASNCCANPSTKLVSYSFDVVFQPAGGNIDNSPSKSSSPEAKQTYTPSTQINLPNIAQDPIGTLLLQGFIIVGSIMIGLFIFKNNISIGTPVAGFLIVLAASWTLGWL